MIRIEYLALSQIDSKRNQIKTFKLSWCTFSTCKVSPPQDNLPRETLLSVLSQVCRPSNFIARDQAEA